MVRNSVLILIACGICFGASIERGFCEDAAKSAKQLDKAIRKFQRLVEADKLDKAERLAKTTAGRHPESPAAKLLIQHSQLLARLSAKPNRLAPAGNAKSVKADDTQLITAQMLIVDVPDTFFERIGVDFDFSTGETAISREEPIGIDVRPLPRRNAAKPPQYELVTAEEAPPYSLVTPLEMQFLIKAMDSTCHVRSRPQIRTLPNQPAEVEIVKGSLGIKLVANVVKDGEQVSLKVDGNAHGESSRVRACIPKGQTLLMSLGTYVIEARSVQAAPVLSKVPYVSRLFKNTGVARETRHRLVLITPQLEIPHKPANLKGSAAN
jgi:hypothetical protein